MNYINDDNPYKDYIKSETKRLQKEFEQSVIENKPFCQPTCKKVGDQKSIIEYFDKKSNTHLAVTKPSEEETVKDLEDEIDINGDSGKMIQQTSKHIQEEFEIEEKKKKHSNFDLVLGGFKQKYTDEYYNEINNKNRIRKLTKKQ